MSHKYPVKSHCSLSWIDNSRRRNAWVLSFVTNAGMPGLCWSLPCRPTEIINHLCGLTPFTFPSPKWPLSGWHRMGEQCEQGHGEALVKVAFSARQNLGGKGKVFVSSSPSFFSTRGQGSPSAVPSSLQNVTATPPSQGARGPPAAPLVFPALSSCVEQSCLLRALVGKWEGKPWNTQPAPCTVSSSWTENICLENCHTGSFRQH